MKKINLNANMMTYDSASEEAYYQERNVAFCQKINEGAPFVIVYRNPLWERVAQSTVVLHNDSSALQYALVVSDGGVLPLPLFFEAMGAKSYLSDDNSLLVGYTHAYCAPLNRDTTVAAMQRWLVHFFGDQYKGCVAPLEVRHEEDLDEVFAFAKTLLTGVSGDVPSEWFDGNLSVAVPTEGFIGPELHKVTF